MISEYLIVGCTGCDPIKDERRFQLKQFAPQENFKFVYEYNFGDSWDHRILVEKISQPDPHVSYPICIKGNRACPPEDVGGIWGYEDFLEAMGDSDNPRYQDMLEWWGEGLSQEIEIHQRAEFQFPQENLEIFYHS